MSLDVGLWASACHGHPRCRIEAHAARLAQAGIMCVQRQLEPRAEHSTSCSCCKPTTFSACHACSARAHEHARTLPIEAAPASRRSHMAPGLACAQLQPSAVAGSVSNVCWSRAHILTTTFPRFRPRLLSADQVHFVLFANTRAQGAVQPKHRRIRRFDALWAVMWLSIRFKKWVGLTLMTCCGATATGHIVGCTSDRQETGCSRLQRPANKGKRDIT